MITTFTTANTAFTLEQFAALEPAWADTIGVRNGVLLARIHPRNNRPAGDEDVLARALVFLPPFRYGEDYADGQLARLTIRTNIFTYDYGPSVRTSYAELLQIVLTLPVIELS